MGRDQPLPIDLETWALLRHQQRLARRLDVIGEFVDDSLLRELTDELAGIERAVRGQLSAATCDSRPMRSTVESI
jgi:hypothetical protein